MRNSEPNDLSGTEPGRRNPVDMGSPVAGQRVIRAPGDSGDPIVNRGGGLGGATDDDSADGGGASGRPNASANAPEPDRDGSIRARARAVRDRIRRVPGGRTAFRIVVAVLGAAIVLAGLVLVPLPGPGWAIVIAGLAVLAIEFAWARRLLRRVRRLLSAWTSWVRRLHMALRLALGAGTLAVLAAVGWLWIKHRYGFETAAQFWEYITTH